MTDATGVTRYGYDHRGNLTGKGLVGSTLGSVSWQYDLADRIVQVRLASGRFVGYIRDDKGRVATVQTRPTNSAAWTVLASNIAYEPFGALKSLDYGNGLKLAQDWGGDRRLASKRLYRADGTDIWHVGYAYDADDNTTTITDLVSGANSRSFGYDSVDRLTRMDGSGSGYAREDYIHDTNGNRTAVQRRTNSGDAAPTESDSFTHAAGTNRLTSAALAAGTRSFTHDARGNLIGETRPDGSIVTLGYDGHARLTSYASSTGDGQAMVYNGIDERTRLTTMPAGGGTATTRNYLYDQHHRLVGEYGATSAALFAETIWLLPEVGGAGPFGGDDGLGGYMPLAVIVAAGGSTAINWVQGNHLGTPVAVTDASGAVVTISAAGEQDRSGHQPVEHREGTASVIGLPLTQQEEVDRPSVGPDHGIGFGGQAAARTSHATGSAIFFGVGGMLMHPDPRAVDHLDVARTSLRNSIQYRPLGSSG